MSFNKQQEELILDIFVPVAIAAGSFLLVALASVYFVDFFILNNPSLKLDGLEISGYLFIVGIYIYCLSYAKNTLLYFTESAKIKRQLLLLIILPGVLGLLSGYSSYKAKKVQKVTTEIQKDGLMVG